MIDPSKFHELFRAAAARNGTGNVPVRVEIVLLCARHKEPLEPAEGDLPLAYCPIESCQTAVLVEPSPAATAP